MRVLALLALLLPACGNDVTVAKGSQCDGQSQSSEGTVDAPYDADQDGYFDGSNPGCAATYDAAQLDCDDQDAGRNPGTAEVDCNGIDDDCDEATVDGPDDDADGFDACSDCADADPLIHPGAAEVACNGIDDDCDAATADAVDVDGDGSSLCEGDCNDNNAAISPLTAEVCDNEIDDDCDNQTDEDCTIDYTGTWTLGSTVSYSCASRYVVINFNEVLISGTAEATTVSPTGSGNRPGPMDGSFASSTHLAATVEYAGGCTEDYTMDVTFSDANHFTGTLLAQYSYRSRPTDCADCTNQTFSITGSR